MVSPSPVPEISISLAPPEESFKEPFSPFTTTGSTPSPPTPVPQDDDGFRAMLLSPPPTVSPRFPRQLSPLRPDDAPIKGKGLERARFEELLKTSRERNVAVGGKRSPDLRKEIAIKVHKTKQVERRALFLSKVQAPPSPSATYLPKTPPESPAIFHYSLPSPGLQSPLSVFEDLAPEDPRRPTRESWVEQVEFRLPKGEYAKVTARRVPPPAKTTKLPSLDQITARLSFRGDVSAARPDLCPSPRLPAFLKTSRRGNLPVLKVETVDAPVHTRPTLPADVGRLHFPSRAPSPPREELPKMEIHAPSPRLPPSPCSPKLQIRTTVIPHMSSFSPLELSESNLRALDIARERTAQQMLNRLRQRTVVPSINVNDEERKFRRHSAPPELPARERAGFTKPILTLPGAF